MTKIFYLISIIAFIISFFKSKEKTILALKKTWKSFENILPQILTVILLIGMALTILTPEQIANILGEETGIIGILVAGVIGAIALIPGFVAFPLAAALLHSGGGIGQIAAFVSTLMMVGLVTIPIESEYFGKKVTLWRNGLAFIFSLVVALIMGVVIK